MQLWPHKLHGGRMLSAFMQAIPQQSQVLRMHGNGDAVQEQAMQDREDCDA